MIIADTGFWLALFDRRDNHHQAVLDYFLTIKEPFITTLPVLTEVCYLLQTRCYPLKATDFLSAQKAGLFNLFIRIFIKHGVFSFNYIGIIVCLS